MIKVIGAGMAGLLAAGMLRNECSEILERQASLPNNHSAVLRFRSSVVGDTLNIPFKKVSVMRHVNGTTNPVADSLNYSFKTNGNRMLRSSSQFRSGEVVERFIAPQDLIQQMARRSMAAMTFDHDFNAGDTGGPIISTVPMPVLMAELDYPGRAAIAFRSVVGTNINAKLKNTEAYVSVYNALINKVYNRVSITGDLLTIEIAWPFGREDLDHNQVVDIVHDALGFDLGMRDFSVSDIELTHSSYAKIMPIDEAERKKFIIWASDRYNIYSLGRYATWRPGLLLDDVVNDVKQIAKMIRSGHSYESRKAV